MSLISFVGALTLLLRKEIFERLILPLVALAAGSLIGGALFHMIPAALSSRFLSTITAMIWLAFGFITFFALEQFLHHHHCHRPSAECKKPLSYLILIGDGLHNLLGGFAVGGTFLVDIRLGITTWLAAAAHEVPQEFGDFAALVHGGMGKRHALLLNFVSALMFPLGAVATYFISFQINTDFLIAFAAGNFLYIGASDLVPEVNKARTVRENYIHFFSFLTGLGLLFSVRMIVD
ncbi:MAG: ZIP family metal transporter [Candidatus Omnitrophica bacterium]|nr:ZIP family metal transporter [Candidatus Omnitrophota bacterium]MDD5670703.1 ZIP family metal transporter [Candidatus Omnitrophota bacterium]